MKHLRLLFAAVVIMMTAAPRASAQTTSVQGGTIAHGVTQVFGFGPAGTIISPKPQAPFSALLVEQMEEALSDGVHINRENEEVVMRDSMGRIYRARTIKVVSSGGNASPRAVPSAGSSAVPSAVPRMIVTITDPVEHVQYICTPTKVCRKMEYRLPPNLRGLRRGLDTSKDRNVTVEDLGTQNIGGVEVEGKRVTRVIPEGMVGNDRAFTTIEELWHSKELDVDVQVKRIDPRTGTHTTTMTEVNLSEPDASYFQIPEGDRIVEGPMQPQPQVEPQPAVNQ